MTSISSIKETYEENPSLMLQEAVRAWIDGDKAKRGGELISTDRPLRVELDGERMGGIVWAGIEIDQDGQPCLMLFRDRTLAAHVATGTGLRLPLAVAEGHGHEIANK